MKYQPKNILVTGSAGFIGSNFVIDMLNCYKDINIISLDKLTYAGDLNNLNIIKEDPRHHFIQGDICDQNLVSKTLEDHHIDTIVHFAAESHVDNSIKDPKSFVQTNVIGTYTMLEAARTFWQNKSPRNEHQCRFHHISTDEVYGTLSKNDPAFTETTPYAPNSPYSATKAGSDHLARAYFHTYKLPITMSNCSNNYGPRQHSEKLIPTIIRSCREQKPIPIYGDGSNIRDWLYVMDHCNAIDLIIRNGELGQTYNIGGNNELNNLNLAKLICEVMDELYPRNTGKYADLISFVKDRAGHDWRYAIDNSKITNELHWQPKMNFKNGLKETIKWCMSLD